MYQLFEKRKLLFITLVIIEIILFFLVAYVAFYFPEHIPYYLGHEIFYFLGFQLLIIVITSGNVLYSFRLLEHRGKKNYIDTSTLMSADIKETYLFGEIGLLNYDDDGEIIWMSDLFINRNINAIGLNVSDWLPTMKVLFKKELNVNQIKLEIDSRIYSVLNLPELKVMIFKDVTDIETLYKTYHEQALVLASIVIDNLTDVTTSTDDNEISELEANVRKTISEWSRKYGIVLRRIKEDSYIAILQESTLRKIIASNFKINDDVRNFKTSNENQLTLSIGLARGTSDIVKLAELASTALDVALSRGGDQTVINHYGGRLEFFGGKSQSKEKSNTVKMRILSRSLATHISSSKQVYVLAHTQADFDAIGACLGVLAISQRFKIPCQIIWEDKQVESKTRQAFKELFTRQTINDITISPQKALESLTDDTLLVVVDGHRPSMTMSPQLVASAKRIALIDHHRRSEEFIDDLLLSIMEPSASSTCEVLAELIRYSTSGIPLSSEYATFMLTGILLDTNRYRVRTTARTYQASMTLKEYGADVAMADEFLKEGYEEYLLKTKIMNNTITPAYGALIVYSPDDEVIERSLLAKIAQDTLQIKGLNTAFVIGKIDNDTVGLSARSNGGVNVQIITEKLGGGGHFNAAAAQFKHSSIKEVIDELQNVLKIYLGEMNSR